jgi:hypothetical protein
MAKKTREDRIKAILKKEPHLTYLEAMKLMFREKSERSKKKLLQKKPNLEAVKTKAKPKRDAMHRALSGGFETNRQKH